MKFHVALLGFDSDHDRLLRFHLAHTRGQAHEFTAYSGSNPAVADIAVIDLDGPDAAATIAALRSGPLSAPRIEVSSDGYRGSSPYRLARPDALSSLPRQLQRVVDTGILMSFDAHWIHGPPPGPAAAIRDLASVEQASTARPFRALVVDADEAIRADLRTGLRRLGVASDAYADAAALEPALRRYPYDLLLLDAQADGGNGYALCRRLRRDPTLSLPPLVMLCGPQAPFDRARAVLCGCAAHLMKPLPWSDFRRVVESFQRQPPREVIAAAPKRRARALAGTAPLS